MKYDHDRQSLYQRLLAFPDVTSHAASVVADEIVDGKLEISMQYTGPAEMARREAAFQLARAAFRRMRELSA